MAVISWVLFVSMVQKSVDVHFTDIAPEIDGYIENTWVIADSAYDFVQHYPYEDEKPSERTVVYMLQDEDNLYVGFRCYADSLEPVFHLTKSEDWVAIGIDPFNCRTMGYYFLLNGSGIYDDGWILDDGRTKDSSWDGVWYHAIKKYNDRYEVEMKIPFKTVRYKKGLSTWGVQFTRYIEQNREELFWIPVSQVDGDLVSRWGTLTGMDPRSSGYYFELYPEAYVRIDRKWYGVEDTIDLTPSISLNAKWDITPQTTFNTTVYPDFAQIESDPFTLNLDRYPTYFNERRPFFLEGKDVFRMSDFGQGKGFFDALEIFYSRKVGRSINGDAIPIISGAKLTHKTENTSIGVLGAYTDTYEHADLTMEPHRGFGVVRVQQRMFGNSNIGMLASGSLIDVNDYNYAVGLDGVYRQGVNQFILQGALSDHNGKHGWAMTSGFFGLLGNLLTIAKAEVISDSFDVEDIGFVPWAGQKEALLLCGPFKQWRTGFMSNIFAAPGAIIVQESGDSNWSVIGLVEINPNTRSGWGCDLSLYYGPYYEADTHYNYRSVNLSAWGRMFGQHLDFGGDYSYSYNYWRGFLAYRSSSWISYSHAIEQHVSVGVSSNLWVEWDTTGALLAMTPRVRPNVYFRFNARTSLQLFSEIVMQTPGSDIGDTEVYSNRFGLLFSWNFMPKSWLYLAVNDYRLQDDQGALQPHYQIGAVKAKYLLYF
jgi:hypothetical protein